MTAPDSQPPFVVRYVEEGAALVARALRNIYDGPRGGLLVREITFLYSDDGVSVTVNPRLDVAERETLYGYFIDECVTAGWGLSTSLDQASVRTGILLRHPSTLTRY